MKNLIEKLVWSIVARAIEKKLESLVADSHVKQIIHHVLKEICKDGHG